jgi:hypothetical protein
MFEVNDNVHWHGMRGESGVILAVHTDINKDIWYWAVSDAVGATPQTFKPEHLDRTNG